MEYMIVNVMNEQYAINVEYIQQIIQNRPYTPIKDPRPFVVGVTSWTDQALKLVALRHLLGFPSFDSEQRKILENSKRQHGQWLEALRRSLQGEEAFSRAVDPHQCDLGKWIDEMSACMKCNEEGFSGLIKEHLHEPHLHLHHLAHKLLSDKDLLKEDAMKERLAEIEHYSQKVLQALDMLKENTYRLTKAFERIIVCKVDTKLIGLLVDDVDRLYKVEQDAIKERSGHGDGDSPITHVFEHEGQFVSILNNQLLHRIVQG